MYPLGCIDFILKANHFCLKLVKKILVIVKLYFVNKFENDLKFFHFINVTDATVFHRLEPT